MVDSGEFESDDNSSKRSPYKLPSASITSNIHFTTEISLRAWQLTSGNNYWQHNSKALCDLVCNVSEILSKKNSKKIIKF